MQVQINGAEQQLEDGAATIAIDETQPLRIQVSHDSGWLEAIDREFTRDDLRIQDFRLQLRRFDELRIQPPDAFVRIDDISRRLVGTTYEHISELCQSLTKVATDICANRTNPNARDIKLLLPLSQAIASTFDPDRDDAAAARDIAGIVGR